MLPLSNSLGLYCRPGRWLSFEVFVSIITPVQDFIEPDTVLKCGALQIKLPAFPPTSKVTFSTLHSSVGRQLVSWSVR